MVGYVYVIVGDHAADLPAEATIVVERKAVKAPVRARTAQSINYLKATGHRVGLLLNFGSRTSKYRGLPTDRGAARIIGVHRWCHQPVRFGW